MSAHVGASEAGRTQAPRLDRGGARWHAPGVARRCRPDDAQAACARSLTGKSATPGAEPISSVGLRIAHGQVPLTAVMASIAAAHSRPVVPSPARRHSSAVEQLFRKQQVLGSNPSVGSSESNRSRPAGRLRRFSFPAGDPGRARAALMGLPGAYSTTNSWTPDPDPTSPSDSLERSQLRRMRAPDSAPCRL